MEIKVIEEKKNRIVFELEGATHTFCNLLKDELRSEDGVKTATYAINHPLVGKPKFTVETSGTDARKALADAAKKIGKLSEKLTAEFKKELK